jgi:hypothetical protein
MQERTGDAVHPDRTAKVWTRLHELAQREGKPVSIRHTCLVCAQAVSAVGAGLSLAPKGGLAEPMYATDERCRELEELQFTLGQGPSVEAMREGSLVVSTDLTDSATQRRWPAFALEATRRGVKSMVAVPIQAGAIRLGVLDCYREQAGAPSGDELAEALVCADAALVLTAQRPEELDSALAELLDLGFSQHQAHVHQAAGMVSVQLDVGIADALARLRAHAYAIERPLTEVAADVVARRFRFGPPP